jgi:hypothetical protein
MRGNVGFVDISANGAPAFIDDSGGGVLLDDTFATVGAQNGVHFGAIAQRLLVVIAGGHDAAIPFPLLPVE